MAGSFQRSLVKPLKEKDLSNLAGYEVALGDLLRPNAFRVAQSFLDPSLRLRLRTRVGSSLISISPRNQASIFAFLSGFRTIRREASHDSQQSRRIAESAPRSPSFGAQLAIGRLIEIQRLRDPTEEPAAAAAAGPASATMLVASSAAAAVRHAHPPKMSCHRSLVSQLVP